MDIDKFAKYVGVQGILAMTLTVALVAWVSTGVQVPQEIYGLLGVSWGFYFAKNGTSIMAQLLGKK